MSHGRPWTAIELAKIHTSFSCQLHGCAAMVSHFLDAETCAFSQVPSMSMDVQKVAHPSGISLPYQLKLANFRKFHRRPWASMHGPWDINVP